MSDRGVCVVTHPLSAAGENATRTLLDILASIGPVSLVTADLPEESSIRDTRDVIELTSKGAGDHILVAALRFVLNQIRMCLVLRRRREPVVLFFGATSYLLPILFARAVGKTVLVEPRGDVPLTLRLNWEQRLPSAVARGLAGSVGLLESAGFAAAHRVVTYTPNMARELGVDPDSDRVYPHGARYVDTERFSVTTPFGDRDDVVGFVGRLDEEKGIRELAEVAKRLPEGVTFRFVGDGPLYEWLASELSEEIEVGAVELAGWVDHEDVPVELNRMKLLVMPSHPTEGLPTTILESLACGTPVYATPVSGVPDVVKEDETGFLMRDREAEAILHDIEDIISTDTALASVSDRGRALIEDEYSFSAAQARYRELLSEVEH
ncbi:glycosyltransferase family 4 protein [Halobellus inordinatus]|uniref:glycosyltransferase family 4 protein n=1 Tax=Halobellus inordinatus TaxID=1126236 RepID=UPI00210C1545|nr:glycosyltransferase [Halobellus inordinatus]